MPLPASLSPQDMDLINRIYPVSRETIDRLEAYRRQLLIWQAKTNLVAPGTLASFWSRHVADSLQVKCLCVQARRFADLGSGGGFPGLVLAIANAGLPGAEHHLIESSQKKSAFLRTVARETGVMVQIHNERIESAAGRIAEAALPPEIVTARALSPLRDLIALALPFHAKGATGVFHKGREYLAEIEECNGLWQFDLITHASEVEAGSVLLEIRHPVRKTLETA